MYSSDFQIAIIVGIVLSILYAEVTGVLPSGLIVPGYLAMHFDQPLFLLTLFFVSFLTYTLVKSGIAKIAIIYGRRVFTSMLVVAIVLKLLLDYAYPILPFEIYALQGIGVIVPGLIAHSIHKQGIMITLSSTFLLGGLTFLFMIFYSVL